MQTVLGLLSLIQTAPQPSVLHNILASLPTDPASLFTLALLVGVTILVVVAGRSSNGKGGKGAPGGGPTSA